MNSSMPSNTGRIRQVYTDGGCHNGPNDDRHGVGSWAFLEPVDISQGYVDVYGEYMERTTNNVTEMMAVIHGIEHVRSTDNGQNHTAWMISDSGYVVNGYNNSAYLDRWIANGWRTSSNKPVLNRELWESILLLSWHTRLTLELIKGHKKDKNPIHAFWNDICDRTCTFIMDNLTMENARFHLRYDFDTKSIKLLDMSLHDKYKPNRI